MARPPVCKLMDYGKFKYESAMKAREARKNQAHTVIKEMKLRPKIDPHDYDTKKGHVVRFLKQGDKVKITIMFRGREQSRPELGYRLLQRLAADVQELGFVESTPKQDGRNMIMVLGPHEEEDRGARREGCRQGRRAGSHRGSRRRRVRTGPAGRRDGRRERREHRGRARPRRRGHRGRAAGLTVPTRFTRTAHAPGHRRGPHHELEQPSTTRRNDAMPKNKTHSGTKKRFQADRLRQGPARAGQPPPPARAQALDADPRASPARRRDLERGRQEDQEASRQVAAGRSAQHVTTATGSAAPGTAVPSSASPRSNKQWHASSGQSTPTRSAGSSSSAPAATAVSGRACTARPRSRSPTPWSTTTATARSARATSASCGSSASTPRPARTA